VLVVDDHQLMGSLLVLALGGRGIRSRECPVTATSDIVRSAEVLRPDLVLLDLDLGVGRRGEPIDELELVVRLRALGCPALIVSASTDEQRIAAAVAAGAVGYLHKAQPFPELLDAVCIAAAGRSPIGQQEREHWLEIDRRSRVGFRHDRQRIRRLTVRERAVLESLARGERASAVAVACGVSVTTVRAQIRSILTKLDVNSQLEAVALLHRAEAESQRNTA
jgi:two-component system, NarL family, nitrate/nitrite response regulator NarL